MGNGERGMGNGEWGMGNGEWGMGNGEWGMLNAESRASASSLRAIAKQSQSRHCRILLDGDCFAIARNDVGAAYNSLFDTINPFTDIVYTIGSPVGIFTFMISASLKFSNRMINARSEL